MLVLQVLCALIVLAAPPPVCSAAETRPDSLLQRAADDSPRDEFGLQESPVPADWMDHRDALNGFRIGHPAFLQRIDRPGVLYAAAGATREGMAAALVVNRDRRDTPATGDDLRASVEESLKEVTVRTQAFRTLSFGAHTAHVAETSYQESDGDWYSLIASVFASGYHYTIAVQASPVPDAALREDIRRAVSSFRLLQ